MSYRSKSTYSTLTVSAENKIALAAWGYSVDPSGMGAGQVVVFDEGNQMVSAVLSADDFANQFEEITS